jgi:hypothetical protein
MDPSGQPSPLLAIYEHGSQVGAVESVPQGSVTTLLHNDGLPLNESHGRGSALAQLDGFRRLL